MSTSRIAISVQELLNLLSVEQQIIRVVDKIISQECWLNFEKGLFEKCFFVNCEFKFGIHLQLNGAREYQFLDCKIELGMYVHEVQSNQIHEKFPTLLLGKCTTERIVIQKSQFEIINIFETDIDDILIEDVIVHGKYLSFGNLRIKDRIRILNTRIKNQLWFDATSVDGLCTLENSEAPQFWFYRTKLSDDLTISHCSGSFDFDLTNVFGCVDIKNTKVNQIEFEGSVFHKEFVFNYASDWCPTSSLDCDRSTARWLIGEISALSSSFLGGLDIGLDWDGEPFLPVRDISFLCTSSSRGDIFLNNLEIEHCHFKGINREGSFHFIDCKIQNSLMFFQFVNHGRIIMNNLTWRKGAQVFFDRAILGPAHFTAISFNRRVSLNFYESDISQISFNSVLWPMNFPTFSLRPAMRSVSYWTSYFYPNWLRLHWHNVNETDDEVIYYFNKREFYRQLKSSAEKMQDRVLALEFQAIEMKAYSKLLQLTKSILNTERIILFLGRTNEHGQNWWKPIWLGLLVSLIFFIPIVIGIDPELTTGNWFTSFLRLIKWYGVFPQLLNPVHSLDKLATNPDAIHPLTWWIDYTHRIVMAFFIFQTVSAFRKYVK